MSLDELLVEIIDALGYEQDKSIFTYKFQLGCLQNALVKLLDNTPDAERADKVNSVNALDFNDPEEFYVELCDIFSEQALEDALTAAMIENMDELLSGVSDSLPEDRRDEINDLANHLYGALA